jgi:hypothetical protein
VEAQPFVDGSLQKDLLRQILEYARSFRYTQKTEYTQRFERTVRYGYEWKYELMQNAESTQTHIVGLPLIRSVRTKGKRLMSTQLYRDNQFDDGYQPVKLAYREQSMPFRFGTDDFSRVIMRLVIVPDNTRLPVCIELPANPYRSEHKFFDALVPAFPHIKAGVYLSLQKRGRDQNGRMKNLGQMYIGRVIQRDKTSDESKQQWTALNMRLAERFVIKRMRMATKAGDLPAWLAWTERYYALKGTLLPLIPDGLEGSAWERDAEGKYVLQLPLAEALESGTTAVPVADQNDDLELWPPPKTRDGG